MMDDEPEESTELAAPSELEPDKDSSRLREAARRTDRQPQLLRMARLARKALPGDSDFGDPLSTAGNKAPDVMARYLAERSEAEPSTMRELGLGALQILQAFSEAQGRGRGDAELTILFTDLVGFSAWALKAGDDVALQLLRDVGSAVEPEITGRGGRIVKRLGDGLMAVFLEAPAALEAAEAGHFALSEVEAEGYSPQLRIGMHTGRPRQVGGDYLGVDVNVAARVAEAANGGQTLLSETTKEQLDDDVFALKQQRFFRAKGTPSDLRIYKVTGTAR